MHRTPHIDAIRVALDNQVLIAEPPPALLIEWRSAIVEITPLHGPCPAHPTRAGCALINAHAQSHCVATVVVLGCVAASHSLR